MTRNDTEIPTNPGTPQAKGLNKLRVMVPINGQLTSGELKDFVTVFTTLGEDIKILEARADENDKERKKVDAQLLELQRAVGRIESLTQGFKGDLDTFMAEIRRIVKSTKDDRPKS